MKLKAIAAAAVLCSWLACGATSNKVASLDGAGATFPAPLYQAWFQTYATTGGHRVNYQAVGSGSGVRQFKAKTVDFGANDGAVSENDFQ